MLSVEARSVLRRIRAKIMGGDWVKGGRRVTTSTGEVRHCLLGHLDVELGDAYGPNSLLYAEVYHALGRATGRRNGWGIVGFNDHSMTTVEDVIAVIDEAAAE